VQLLPGASPLPASSSCSAAVAGSLPPAYFLFMQCSCCGQRDKPNTLPSSPAVQSAAAVSTGPASATGPLATPAAGGFRPPPAGPASQERQSFGLPQWWGWRPRTASRVAATGGPR
jgi:hypothetical protein